MSYYLAEIRFNKKSENSGKKETKKRQLIPTLLTLALISLLVSSPTLIFSSTVNAADEPSLVPILESLGFTNIALSTTETFLPGMYSVTLYAEFATYNPQNELSYYSVGTSDFNTIFAGPEGATGYYGGYVEPPLTKMIDVESQFGLSMLTREYRYFTQHDLNPDAPEVHAQVYANLDVPGMFLIGFENRYGAGNDRDYNDMVFSLVPLAAPEIVSVMRNPVTPNYDQSVTISAQVQQGFAPITSVILDYQINSGSWGSVFMSLESGLYVANIPARPYNTIVSYQVSATDALMNSDVSALFSYTVGDFVSPVISDVNYVPTSPYPYESVAVSAKVTEPADASGVKTVTLWYTEASTWTSTTMTLNGGFWTANIPGQGAGLPVSFFVEAFDNADNNAKSSTFGYTIIDPNVPPVALFTKSAATVYTGETIDFDASASYDTDGTIVSYVWNFGDGTTGSGVTASHSYADNGAYTVTLTVTDDGGATDTETDSVTVNNRPPVAVMGASSTLVDKEEVVTFDASGSYDVDGTIVSYSWNFGDGTTATGVTTSHSYTSSGTYTVTLTVTDDDGATDTTTDTITVNNIPPVAVFTASAHTVETDETIDFDASASYDPDGTIVSYSWDFGDGATGSGVTASHSYVDNGEYTVTLTVTDDDGAFDTETDSVTVNNRAPVAVMGASSTLVDKEEIITFDASSSYDPDGTIVSYSWDFGDGTTATGVTTSHSYTSSGTYTVTLTVTDDDGATDSTTTPVTVRNKAPIAFFTESAHTVFTGEVIDFDASGSSDPDGTIVSYSWDFGDGATATGVSVSHAYTDNGSYTVTLTVTDNDGATDSVQATKTVINRPPAALFTASAHTVFTGETIDFDASSSYDLDGTIVSYSWDFGDGTTATGVTTSHSYASLGTYTVTLTVIDDDGASDTETDSVTVNNRAPVAVVDASPAVVNKEEDVTFDASASYDPDGTIVSYSWNFGDGTTGSGVTATHSYVDNGEYTVTLTVTDDDGATDSTTAPVTVRNRAPIAFFTESAHTVFTGETITFDASASYDSDGTIVSYLWDFGDGATATGVAVSHAYVNNNLYIVTLTVTDNGGATGSTTAMKTVLNRRPVASFTESAHTVDTDETIDFDARSSYDPDGTIVSYSWNFGDGTIATGVTASHSYGLIGTYTVTLTVTDDDGATSSASATKTVTVLNCAPVANFTESAHVVETGETIDFDASGSYDSDGTIVSYLWDFGDGATATGVSVSHAYADNGSYTVNLTVTDNDGATDSVQATKTVMNRPPVASFTESAHTVDNDETINFDASDSYDLDGTIISYVWDFGDGTTATGVTTSHSYGSLGTYTVTLTVTDDDGATDSATATKTVVNRPPVASFTESAHTVFTGEVIDFDASGSSDPDGTIVSYVWDFGDGHTDTGVKVSHNFAYTGSYVVTLTVTDNDGATDSATATKTVVNRPPVADFTESAHTVNTGETIDFDASDSYDVDGTIVSYSWDFGDGTTATGVTPSHAYEDDGVYTVTLTVVDNEDATDSVTATKTVLNRGPVADFTESAHTVDIDETISFDASGSSDPDGTIVSYSWDFGDGTTATGVTVDHAYSEYGTYTVTLTVTDDDGESASTVDTKIVETGTMNGTFSLAMISVIGLGITALTATLLYAFYIRRKKKRKSKEN